MHTCQSVHSKKDTRISADLHTAMIVWCTQFANTKMRVLTEMQADLVPSSANKNPWRWSGGRCNLQRLLWISGQYIHLAITDTRHVSTDASMYKWIQPQMYIQISIRKQTIHMYLSFAHTICKFQRSLRRQFSLFQYAWPMCVFCWQTWMDGWECERKRIGEWISVCTHVYLRRLEHKMGFFSLCKVGIFGKNNTVHTLQKLHTYTDVNAGTHPHVYAHVL